MTAEPDTTQSILTPAEILRQVRRIEITTGRLVAETFAGEYLSVFKGHGIEFAEVREYSAGDDVRSIDWNVTARLGRPFIKRFTEERELTLMIACDISGSQHFGSRDRLKSEMAAELSAMFAFSALQNSDKTGLLLFTDKTELYIPPRKGKTHVLRLIRELLAHKPKSAGTSLSACLDTLNRVFKRRGILILISDFMDEGYEKPFAVAARRHDLIPVLVSDPLESAVPALPALLEVRDPETGGRTTLDLSSRQLRSAHEAARRARVERCQKFFASHGLEHIAVTGGAPVADPVVRFFKRRSGKIRR
ncbi:MAG: DUF58 domain-containing protein [Elusimicrobiales bacterium]|nr:DUF58 domain-containing protein [Elusimicrobiales bacterium]